MIELGDEDRAEIESWLRGEFDPEATGVLAGRRLGVVLCDLAGRDPARLARAAERLGEFAREPLVLRPRAELEARPSRQWPRLFFLPFDCRGRLLKRIGTLGSPAVSPRRPEPGDVASEGATRRLLMPVAEMRLGPGLAPEELGPGQAVPRYWPGPVPARLRRPMNAVRLALYPSQTTSESREPTPLAQVELPVAAAVR